MQAVEIIALTMGVAWASGINLYAAVLMLGLMGLAGHIQLPPELHVLMDPLVLLAAGFMYCVEFFADKVPWGDSLWDVVHTVVRPAGAILIGLQAVGETQPVFQVVVALLAGGAAATTHAAKAGTRVAINHSPEPASNIAVSLAEDAGVVGGVALIAASPVLALAVFTVLLIALWILMPRVFRRLRSAWWLLLNRGDEGRAQSGLPLNCTVDEDIALSRRLPAHTSIDWAVRCAAGKVRGFSAIRSHMVGSLAHAGGDEGGAKFWVAGRRWWRPFAVRIDLAGCEIRRESRFLSEVVTAFSRGGDRLLTLRLPRGNDSAQRAGDLWRRLEANLAPHAHHVDAYLLQVAVARDYER
ncbi:MAG: DUF4126 domain-containing protein, partial [Gammaproteobacteria bacterium]|nr:DUF4126 domain-containing protein [Gammaproteobacteria bacterium]